MTTELLMQLILSRHIWVSPSFLIKRRLWFCRNESVKLLYLDIDGVLWADITPGQILTRELDSISAVVKVISQIEGKVVFITNQTLFARDKNPSFRVFLRYIWRVIKLCNCFGAVAFLVCHHHPSANNLQFKSDCKFRKPSAKMIEEFRLRTAIDFESSLLIGDRITDIKCGNSAAVSKCIIISNKRMFEINESSASRSVDHALFSVAYQNLVDLKDWYY